MERINYRYVTPCSEYEVRRTDPEETIRRAEGCSYLTDEDVERITSRERARQNESQ